MFRNSTQIVRDFAVAFPLLVVIERLLLKEWLIALILAACLRGIVVSISLGNRKLPFVALGLGLFLAFGIFIGILGAFGFAGIALITAIVWVSNKLDLA